MQNQKDNISNWSKGQDQNQPMRKAQGLLGGGNRSSDMDKNSAPDKGQGEHSYVGINKDQDIPTSNGYSSSEKLNYEIEEDV